MIMKRKIGICLLVFLFLFLVTFGAGFFFTSQPNRENQNTKQPETESQAEESILSSKEEQAYRYIVFSEDGKLVVYYSDGETLFFNSGVSTEDLSEKWKEQVEQGIRFYSQEELLEFLEAYSS